MLLEILAKVEGNFRIESEIEIKSHPFLIKLYFDKEKSEYYLSVRKKMYNYLEHLPIKEEEPNGEFTVILPQEDFYEDIIQIMQHLESFGALDVSISKINWESPRITWIPEKEEEEGIAPVYTYKKTISYDSNPAVIKEEWLFDTIVHRRQLKELYIPFSFFREGMNLYHQLRYQSSFCFLYMMLEYFFHDSRKGYGIKNSAHLEHIALNTSLENAIIDISNTPFHLIWINDELKKSNKEFNPEGIIFILNKYRDNFSHAAKKDKNRNVLKETSSATLAYLALSICKYVSIKMRLLPFIREQEKEAFLKR